MVGLEEIKQFLRIDTDAEDLLLTKYAEAAEKYIKSACGEAVCMTDPRTDLVQLMLIADWFENRTMYSNGSYSRSINSMMTQLRLEAED